MADDAQQSLKYRAGFAKSELDFDGAREAVRSVVEEAAFELAALPSYGRGRGLQAARKRFEICFLIHGVEGKRRAHALLNLHGDEETIFTFRRQT